MTGQVIMFLKRSTKHKVKIIKKTLATCTKVFYMQTVFEHQLQSLPSWTSFCPAGHHSEFPAKGRVGHRGQAGLKVSLLIPWFLDAQLRFLLWKRDTAFQQLEVAAQRWFVQATTSREVGPAAVCAVFLCLHVGVGSVHHQRTAELFLWHLLEI